MEDLDYSTIQTLEREIQNLEIEVSARETVCMELETKIDHAKEYIKNHLRQDMLSDYTGETYLQEYISDPQGLIDILEKDVL